MFQTKQEPQEVERQTNQQLVAAYKVCKGEGVPELVERRIEKITTTQVPWQVFLFDFFHQYSESDYSFDVPDRRFDEDMIMPSLIHKDSLRFVIAIDVSPSTLEHQQISRFVEETKHLLDDIEFKDLTVIYCADFVTGYQRFSKSDEIKLEFKGGSWTKFYPVWDKVEELGLNPACLVYFTDLLANSKSGFGQQPPYPVKWVTYSNQWKKHYDPLPFGSVLSLPSPSDW